MVSVRRPLWRGRWIAAWLLAAGLALLPACGMSKDDPVASGEMGEVKSGPAAAPEAQSLLAEAERAAGSLNRYAFSLYLTQRISDAAAGAAQDAAGSATGPAPADPALEWTESVTDSEGRVETDPLKIDQTLRTSFAGETSEYRTILVPDGYYVYDTVFRQWGKLPADEAEQVAATFSDFQVDLPGAIRQVAALGPAVASRDANGIVIRYEGGGEPARTFVVRLLESTLGWATLDEALRESLEVQHLLVELTLDPQRRWPVACRLESRMALAAGDGERTILEQTLTAAYRKHNATAAIELPKEAKEAPELGPPLEEPESP